MPRVSIASLAVLILPACHKPPSTAGMVLLPAGTFTMGTNDAFPAERPTHVVDLPPFWMDTHEVTVAEFDRFVTATNHRTDSERLGWSGAFHPPSGEWSKTDGADWRHPGGPSSHAKPDEPVTQVSWNDAAAYCRWAGKRLPTEAEFELALRGGLAEKKYPWGDDLVPGGKYLANFWQGPFPATDLGLDGSRGVGPVGSYPPNPFGLFDICGNVWEWCADGFDPSAYSSSPRRDPRGPERAEERVIRGGSWMCSESYCQGYRCAARNHAMPDSALDNLGFRCVRDP